MPCYICNIASALPQLSIAGVISVTLPPFAAAVAVLQVTGLQIVTPRFHVKHCQASPPPPPHARAAAGARSDGAAGAIPTRGRRRGAAGGARSAWRGGLIPHAQPSTRPPCRPPALPPAAPRRRPSLSAPAVPPARTARRRPCPRAPPTPGAAPHALPRSKYSAFICIFQKNSIFAVSSPKGEKLLTS